MHVLLLIGDMDPRVGGPPQVVAGSATALADRGHRVTIATLARPSLSQDRLRDMYPALAARGISILSFAPDAGGMPGSSRAMARHATDNITDYDAMHMHGIWENCAAQVAAVFRANSKPVFVSAHGMLDRWSMKQSRLKKWIALHLTNIGVMLRRADAIVYGTVEERDQGIAVIRGQTAVIPNGVDREALTLDRLPDATPITQRFPAMASWSRTLLYFSRIHPKKGLDLLVDAMIELAPRYPGVGLLAVGIAQDEAYRQAIEQRVTRSGLAARFAITTDLAGSPAKAAFRLADVFVLPSHQEGFSMAIIEAMTLGKPLLITDKCHLPEIAERGAGEVVADNAQGMRAGLAALLGKSRDELAAMGARGMTIVRERYEWRTIATQLEALYSGALSR